MVIYNRLLQPQDAGCVDSLYLRIRMNVLCVKYVNEIPLAYFADLKSPVNYFMIDICCHRLYIVQFWFLE